MSDDLATILKSIRNTQANILARLSRLEQGQQEQVELSVPASWGRSSPTSPPSKRLAVRHGRAWNYNTNVFHSLFSESWEDFALELTNVSAFTNAYWYRAVVPYLCLNFAMSGAFSQQEMTTDYETFEECAAEFEKLFNWSQVKPHRSSYALFPLCAIALRNNGTTGSTGEYLPITLTDRMQSSFICRDLRPWFSVVDMRA